jgi:hypothetical protein
LHKEVENLAFIIDRAPQRDVEDLLAERGIGVSYETLRRWVNHFGPMIAADLRKRRPKPQSKWHLDEVYLKIVPPMNLGPPGWRRPYRPMSVASQ